MKCYQGRNLQKVIENENICPAIREKTQKQLGIKHKEKREKKRGQKKNKNIFGTAVSKTKFTNTQR